MDIISVLEENLKPYSGKKFLLGVSGGKDSMALLSGMISLRDKYDFKIFVIHVNHGLRGAEAERDLNIVKDFCDLHNVPFYARYCNMRDYAKQNKLSEEEAGRELRRNFFYELKEDLDLDYIVLAHQSEDRVETVLFRILRGTGVKGLSGMQLQTGDILRPLLNVKRKDIEAYIFQNDIPFGEDSSNFENYYTRNKIRNVLIPFLKEEFDFNTDSILRLSDNAREIWSLTEKEIDRVYTKVVHGNSISVENFKSLEESMRLLVLHRAFEAYSLGRADFLRMSDWIVNGKSGSILEFTGGRLERAFGEARLLENDFAEDFNLPFVIGNVINIKGVGKISSSEVSRSEVEYGNKNIIFVDKDKLSMPLTIRTRRDGDRIAPFGMKGEKKLKDIFREEKIPKSDRIKIPVIESRGEILWLAGLRDSRNFKIDEDTKSILKIKFEEE